MLNRESGGLGAEAEVGRMGGKTNKQGTLTSHVLPKKDQRIIVLRRWEVSQAFTGNLNWPQTFDPQPPKCSDYRHDPPIPAKDWHCFPFWSLETGSCYITLADLEFSISTRLSLNLQ